MMGETFASRVAGSLLVGMGEMVAYNDAEYIRVADALLIQPERLGLLRQHLDAGRKCTGLFNPHDYAFKLEDILAGISICKRH